MTTSGERRERAGRRQEDLDVRRLNDELERRVAQRTTQLAEVNAALTRQRAELADAKLFLENLLAASPSMIFRFERDLRITYASPNVGWLLGYGPAELLAPDFWKSIIHPDDRTRVLDRLDIAMDKTVSQIEQEYRIRTQDGHYRWFFNLLRIEYGEDTQPLAVLGYVLDITDRKEAEEEVLRAHAFLDSILRQSGEAIIVADADGVLRVFNPAAQRLYGMIGDEVAADQWVPRFKLFALDGRPHELENLPLFRAVQGEAVQEARWIVERPDGERRTLVGSAAPLRGADGRGAGAVLIARDDTDRLAADEKLRFAQLEAERANRAKSAFLSRMSHDLRTPLNAILGFAQLIEMDARSPEEADNVQQIISGGRHLLNLINEILDISSIEAGRLSLAPQSVPVSAVVRDVMHLITPLAASRHITLNAANDNDYCVFADVPRLRQIFFNLIGNAVKYSHYGGSVQVISERSAKGSIRTSVSDVGPGIPVEKLALLFQPFERFDAERGPVEGTGLGLALAKGLVEAMGGTMGVSSEVNRGTTFWFDLPESQAAGSREGSEPVTGTDSPVAPAIGGAVLYIEDDAPNVRLLERVLLRRPGVRLVHATDGAAGIRLAGEARPHLILLDFHLPDMTGEEVLESLLADPATRDIPVGVLSADTTQALRERLLAGGAVAFLEKPLEVRYLLDLVDECLPSVEDAVES